MIAFTAASSTRELMASMTCGSGVTYAATRAPPPMASWTASVRYSSPCALVGCRRGSTSLARAASIT